MRVLLLFAIACAVQPAAASISLSLNPVSGSISGVPGETVGWGFAINNTTSDFLFVNDSNFTGSGLVGTYTDFVSGQFIVVGPPPETSSVSEAFSLSSQTGLGSFTIDSASAAGDSEAGDLEVDYSLFSQDPNSPNFDPGSFVGSGTLKEAASVFVSSAVTATPEPSTLVLAFTGLVSAGLFARRRFPFLGPR
ncbi:MAG TPA: PEP-CTERM sorting domain-containing protein [Acidobacteriaceae bacterium]|nr:PEP-CTERM sorting domain-containing protein [Acidobacteriaceae bacterium]